MGNEQANVHFQKEWLKREIAGLKKQGAGIVGTKLADQLMRVQLFGMQQGYERVIEMWCGEDDGS